MALPPFNEAGDLPEGIHPESLDGVLARFGRGSDQPRTVTTRLRRIVELAITTGNLDYLVVFGSYVSDKEAPNDVDVILVMRDDFRSETCPAGSSALFDHSRAHDELGASIFWVRPDMLMGEPLVAFLSHWQTKRDGTQRGIVEIRP